MLGTNSKKEWRPVESDGAGGKFKYVQMILDSGAGCTAFPASLGDGYPLKSDERVGVEYGGAIVGMTSKDEGQRTINTLNIEHIFGD